MRRNATPSMGALHPVLFFLFVYGISLLLAIFVCRTVYNSLNDTNEGQTVKPQFTDSGTNATASR